MNFDLKAFRKRFGLKQVEVAHLFNCGQSNISDIETGKEGLKSIKQEFSSINTEKR
ncbi:helix-turn-helix domain-containing protein [Bacteroides fragilis]